MHAPARPLAVQQAQRAALERRDRRLAGQCVDRAAAALGGRRGREVTHPERGVALLDRLAEELSELAVVEQRPNLDGRNMTMILGPSKAVLAGETIAPSDNGAPEASEEGGFLYDSDSYADELPYWLEVAGRGHLVIPYVLDPNDFKFLLPNGFVTAGDFLEYLVDTFEQLHEDGGRMMSVGLHCRIVGRPAAPVLSTAFSRT